MKKILVISLLSLIVILSISACTSNNNENLNNAPNTIENIPEESKIKVAVTFDAMKEFVEAVAKDKVEITTIISAGSDSHDFEPKVQDMETISKSSIFVYNGLEMERWVDDALSAVNNPKLIVINASEGADVIEIEDPDDHSHEHDHDDEHEHNHGHSHSHGKYDPHLWLSLKGAQIQVKNIKDTLVQVDPSNQEYYEKNYNDFISKSESLYKEYYSKFEGLENSTFVTGHAAFEYLARDFNLEQNSITNVFAEGEPSAKQLGELVEYCRENNITSIFSEEMVSPAVSQTLANEIGAKFETIYTIEYAQDDMTYLERMEFNLSKIYDSLK